MTERDSVHGGSNLRELINRLQKVEGSVQEIFEMLEGREVMAKWDLNEKHVRDLFDDVVLNHPEVQSSDWETMSHELDVLFQAKTKDRSQARIFWVRSNSFGMLAYAQINKWYMHGVTKRFVHTLIS